MKNSHPNGLYLLFFTEMWERFSYYGMRALFALYLIQALMFDKNLTSNIYGSFTGLVYLSPLIGGYLADKFLGNRKSIIIGGIVMAIGHFLLFLSASNYQAIQTSSILMYAGLGVLVIGNGFFKPNISSLVGQLYPSDDRRIDSAYVIFYMGINIGAFFSPLICGTLGNTGNPDDFKWGFLIACIGMIISVAIFVALKNKLLISPQGEHIGILPNNPNSKKEENNNTFGLGRISALILLSITLLVIFYSLCDFDIIGSCIFSFCIVIVLYILTEPSLSKIERDRIWVIVIISFFVIFFWSAYEQAGASLTFFAEEQTNRNIGNYTIPTSYLQSLNPIFIVVLSPLFVWLWTKLNQKGKEPNIPMKQAIGLFLLSIGYLIISIGVKDIESDTKVSILWITSLYFTLTLGELCLSPIGLSMVNKLSPARYMSLLMAIWLLSSATANKFAGILSGLYPEFDHGVLVQSKYLFGFEINSLHRYFMIFVIMSGIAAIILFALNKFLIKKMHGVK